MKVLELFAGSRSIGKVAKELGMEVFSVDVFPFEDIDCVKDILHLMKYQIKIIPDMIWASPPCTTYSIAAISHHRNGQLAISDFAKVSDKIVKKTLDIISWFPDVKYYIENPVGMLRKMEFMQKMDRATITYCSYGDKRMKPTDIWSNNIYSMYNTNGWKPRKKCFNGNTNCHHEPAPRGSRTGTQGLKNDFERSKIPRELCIDILMNLKNSCV